METATPEGTPPATVTTPVAAQPATSSSTVQASSTQQPEIRTPLDVRRAIEEMKRQPKQQAPAPTPAAEPAAVEATPAADPVAEPAPSEATPEAAPGDPEQPAAPAEEGDDTVTPLTGKRAHIRVNEADEVGKLALAYQMRNRDWTLEQAIDAAKKQLGVTPQTTEATPTTSDNTPQMPKTVQETDTTVAQKLAEYKKAMAEVRFEDAADIQTEIMKLSLHRSTLERNADTEAQRAEAKYHADYDKAEAKASELYAFMAEPESPAAKRMKEIEATLKATEDPLYYSPQKPLKIAQMVAAELNIAPKSKTATPAKPAAAPAQTQAPKKGVVPSGSARTVPPAPKPAIDPEIANIKTPADFRAQMRKLKVPGY